EFIGGPFPMHHFAGFWDGTLFRRPISELSVEEMQAYFELYNIGWIVAQSEVSKRYFDSMPGVVPLDTFREVTAYKVNRRLSFFISGAGRVVERRHNRVIFADLVGSEIILKYHFLPGLKSEPPTTLVPVYYAGDPTPFLKIIDPPSRLALSVK